MLSLSPSPLSLSNLPLTLRCSPSSANPRFSKIRSSTTSASAEEERESAVTFPAIKAAKRVVLVRHGQSTWNAEGRIQGSSNFSVLTSKGEAQAETSRQMLLHDSFDVCFASPLARSKRTAEIIWDSRKEPIISEFDLREIDLYSFQGLLKHEGKEKFGDVFRQWQLDAPNFFIDGHYPVRELWARARSCWDRILIHESKSVLVVAHNAVNQALIATAIGLGTEYFRILLQSNCGVSVLDFIPRPEVGSPLICLNRLNQIPSSPLADGSSAGRKTSHRIVLVSYGSLQSTEEETLGNTVRELLNLSSRHLVPTYTFTLMQEPKGAFCKIVLEHSNVFFKFFSVGLLEQASARVFSKSILDLKLQVVYSTGYLSNQGDLPMNMLGIIQKTAELLLDLKVDTVVSSPRKVSVEAAKIILQVQEAADCLGADCVPRSVDVKEIEDLDVENMLGQSKESGLEDRALMAVWYQARKVWQTLLEELSNPSDQQRIVVVVGHPTLHIALMSHCLNLTQDWMGSFHLDEGSVSVIDFPDGPTGRGTIRCINYTAHLGSWAIPITKT